MVAIINRVKAAAQKSLKPAAEKVLGKSGTDFSAYVRMVEKKAYELYEKRGCRPGHDKEDWAEAEKLVENELCR